MSIDVGSLRQAWPRPSKPQPIVIIGTGGIVTTAHLPAYEMAKFEVAGVFDLDTAKARDVAARWHTKAFASLEEAIATPDAVYDLALPPGQDRLVRAVAAFDSGLVIVSSTSRAIEGAAAAAGLMVATTFLADRAYDDDGLLVSRKLPGAVIHDETQVLARVRRMLREGVVITHSGKALPMRPRSILLHGDTAGSVDLARGIRREIEAGGGRVVAISKQLAPGGGGGQA